MKFPPYTVSCGELTPPPSGYLNGYESTVEGSEIYYSCNTGLVPVEQMVTVCLANGEWTPNPAEHNCTEPSTCKVHQQPTLDTSFMCISRWNDLLDFNLHVSNTLSVWTLINE